MWQSTNPALAHSSAFSEAINGRAFAMERDDVTTVTGVIQKTAFLSALALGAGAVGYMLFANNPSILWISNIAALVVALGVGFVLCGNPKLSAILAPIYAIVEGTFLGSFTALADSILRSRGLGGALGGVGAQALIVTGSVLVAMLGLYRTGIVRPTETFRAVVGTATIGIMLAYAVSFVLSLFWQPLPLISFASAMQNTGWIGLLGLGVNVFILLIASLWLVIDFGRAEQAAVAAAPKYMEWYCGFAMLVTLAWIYYEAVKLVFRLAILLNSRD